MVKNRPPAPGVPHGERSDEDLVAALVEGDEAALAELYDRHADVLFRAALMRLGDRQLAEEVLQDTYLALWNRAELFDRAAGTLIGWLSAIGRNRAVDRLRARGRRPPPVPLSRVAPFDDGTGGAEQREATIQAAVPIAGVTAASDPEVAVELDWLRTEVRRALAAMPVAERDVITLAYYEELSQSEIAERLAWPLGTVKTRTRRALGRLRESLAAARADIAGGER